MVGRSQEGQVLSKNQLFYRVGLTVIVGREVRSQEGQVLSIDQLFYRAGLTVIVRR